MVVRSSSNGQKLLLSWQIQLISVWIVYYGQPNTTSSHRRWSLSFCVLTAIFFFAFISLLPASNAFKFIYQGMTKDPFGSPAL